MGADNKFQDNCGVESPNHSKRPRRSVSFQPTSTLYSYTSEEPVDGSKLWYSEEDKELSRVNAALDVFLLKQLQSGESLTGYSLSPDNITTVGLEKHLLSLESITKRKKLKKVLSYVVLMEQARGSKDKAERIALVATPLSKWSADQARLVGEIQYKESRRT